MSRTIEILAFTEKGFTLAEGLARSLDGRAARCGQPLSLKEWTGRYFSDSAALVFVGAVGIAVRAIAPHLQSKATDPAVVAVDERGQFAVSLLSGHLGGANDLARRIAGLCGGTAVITTATDVNDVFAVDEWARRQHCALLHTGKIKEISSTLLAGGSIAVKSDFDIQGEPPRGIRLTGGDCRLQVSLRPDSEEALWAIPRIVVLGVGCRKGTSHQTLETFFQESMRAFGLAPESVCAVATIDLKKEEPGLVEFCARRQLPLVTYPAQALAQLTGVFSASDFVKKATGVDNVCERASALAAGGPVYRKKRAGSGVTMAVALRPYKPTWRWKDE